MKFLKRNNFLIALIVIVSAMKLQLIGKGFLTFPDENRYIESGEVLKSLYEGDFHSAIVHIFATQGRPGDAIVKLIPTVLQKVTANIFGFEMYETRNAFPLFFYNFLIYGVLLWVHFKFSLLFLKDRFLSLFGVLVFSTLIVSYISLRHADPYDASLLILYFVLYKMIQKPIYDYSNVKLFGFGILAFFGYLSYPGYILLFAAIPMFLFFDGLTKENWKQKIKPVIIFGSGSFLCLVLFEIAAQFVGQSYILFSKALSTSITQGSFEECFSFLFKYLYEAEGFNGLFLIFGLLLFVILSGFDLMKKQLKSVSKLQLLFLILLLLFVSYSAFGYYFEKVVWYARLLKQFIPFLIIFGVFSVQKIIEKLHFKFQLHSFIFLTTSILLSFNFYLTLNEYKTIYYPKDVAWAFYNRYHITHFEEVFEYNKSRSEVPELIRNQKKSIIKKAIFVNFCDVYPFDNLQLYEPYLPPKNYNLIFSKPSFLNFKAYQFEGCKIQHRNNFDRIAFNIKAYQKQ